MQIYAVVCQSVDKIILWRPRGLACAEDEEFVCGKLGFAKARRKTRVPYNDRIAFMKAHSPNAVSAKEPWGDVKTEGQVPVWRDEAARLAFGGNNVYDGDVPLLVQSIGYMFTHINLRSSH